MSRVIQMCIMESIAKRPIKPRVKRMAMLVPAIIEQSRNLTSKMPVQRLAAEVNQLMTKP